MNLGKSLAIGFFALCLFSPISVGAATFNYSTKIAWASGPHSSIFLSGEDVEIAYTLDPSLLDSDSDPQMGVYYHALTSLSVTFPNIGISVNCGPSGTVQTFNNTEDSSSGLISDQVFFIGGPILSTNQLDGEPITLAEFDILSEFMTPPNEPVMLNNDALPSFHLPMIDSFLILATSSGYTSIHFEPSMGPNIAVTPASYNFGNLLLSAPTESASITISNIGNEDLIVSEVSITNRYNFTYDIITNCGSYNPTIPAGSNCSIDVSFHPDTVGPLYSILTINSNDPDTPSIAVQLTGNGLLDNEPYFSNASLPSSVTYPDTIHFSGSIADDNGLSRISMSVSGPKGTHTVFAENITGQSKSLSNYYFDSNNATYSGVAGSYIITLSVTNDTNKTATQTFDTTVMVPAVDNEPYFSNASLPSSVTYPDTIHFSGSIADDNGLSQISMSVSGPKGNHTVFTENITGQSKSLSNYYFDSNNATYSGVAGSYTITLTVVDDIGQIATKGFSTALIVPAVDNDPYFSNASLPSSVTYPDTIHFSGSIADDIGLSQISMFVSGPKGNYTVFTENITGQSKSLSNYYFDSNNATYSGVDGSYTLTMTAIDASGQSSSMNFNVSLLNMTHEHSQKVYGLFIGQNYFWESVFHLHGLKGDLMAEEICYNFANFDDVEYRNTITDKFFPVTLKRISDELDKIKKIINPGDVLFLYLVGHGGSYTTSNLDENTASEGDEYIYLADMLGERFILRDDELAHVLSGMDQIEKWVFLDFCNSGGFWGNNNAQDDGDLEKLHKTSLVASASETGLGYYISNKYDPNYGRTLFGIALREAFIEKNNGNLRCDRNDDGTVEFSEIVDWIKIDFPKITGWQALQGVEVSENGFGDTSIFSWDEWSPISKKTDDFIGTLAVDLPDSVKANAGGPYSGKVGTQIKIDASVSRSPDGNLIRYEWDWENDGIFDENSDNPIATHIWTKPYNGTIKLRATDDKGNSDIDSAPVEIVASSNYTNVNEGAGGGGCFIDTISRRF